MKSTQYSAKVLEHFRNPRNVGTLEGDDVAVGRVGNPVCGDLMDIYIRVQDDRIVDIKFKTFGCGSAVATSSMITEMAKGKTLDEAMKITRNNVAEELDGLPPIKMHCSNLAADALHKAIKNWRSGIRGGAGIEEIPQVEGTCKGVVVTEPKEIIGLDEFLEKGVYKEYEDLEKFRDKRVLIVENGEKTIQLAIDLTKITGRVIWMTALKYIFGSDELKKKLKRSDVKVLLETELLEIIGTNSVEKVRVHDLNEDEEYELFVDTIILP
ncbi:MAG: Fe-S cluster assembly scaffold protein NifU [Candidatus Helarchaeota archaeon]